MYPHLRELVPRTARACVKRLRPRLSSIAQDLPFCRASCSGGCLNVDERLFRDVCRLRRRKTVSIVLLRFVLGWARVYMYHRIIRDGL